MKQHNHPIQRSGLTKAIVIALSICSLSSTNKADASQLNTNMFIHALPDKIDTNVLSELDSI
ncbi:MAG: hypothetical protein LBF56_01180, partial [Holosporales bacterium]|nr:hypothetical protein [Holosporales bacterium]